MNRWVLAAVLLAGVAGLCLRAPQLEQRPLHNDEGVNAYKFAALWQTGDYVYDPNEHHGPTLYYASWLWGKLTLASPDPANFSEARLRFLIVVFGLGLIALLPLVSDALGRRATAWAAWLTAVSPAMVYYSRYYIHEMLLVWSTFLALAAGWRYWRTRKPGWAVLAGLGLGLMAATKETFVITLIAVVLALATNQAWNRWLDASGRPIKAQPLNGWHLAVALVVGLLVAVLFFTSFFTNPAGVLDSVRTYVPWLNRAAGDSPHIHPWYFYLERTLFFHSGKGAVWTEALIFALAVIGGTAGFFRKKLGRASASFVRFLALYTFALCAGYSLISYKTPWCLLSFWHTAILLAGVGVAVLFRIFRGPVSRLILPAALVLGMAHLGWQAWATSYQHAADPRNPYVYAHTSPHLLRLVSRVHAISDVAPERRDVLLKVMAADDDVWPLPWYLRDFRRVGWWDTLQPDPYAPIMIVSSRFDAQLDEKKTHLMVGYFQLRPQTFFELYVELELWKKFLRENPPSPEASE